MKKPLITTVIFDWARVLCDVSWGYASKKLEEIVGFDDKQKMKDAYFPALLQREVGALERNPFWEGVIRSYGLVPDESSIDAFATAYQSVAGQPFSESLALLRELQAIPEITTAILTNAAPELYDVIENSEERSLVDASFYSFSLGARKPQKECYLQVLEALQATPSSTLFVDDQQKNTEGATVLGIHTIHFTEPAASTEKIRQFLQL